MQDQEQQRTVTRHSIGLVSRRTGLKPDVIRAWERRYQAIAPSRTGTNRRFYSDEEVERLTLLRRATLAGRQIGQVCHLTTEQLKQLVAEDEDAINRAPHINRPAPLREGVVGNRVEGCVAAIEDLDSRALQYQLDHAALELTPIQVIQNLLVPLLQEIGDRWEEGTLRVAHEHMASAVISGYLTTLLSSYATVDPNPTIVIGTPSRQLHDLGALMVAASAASEGWRVIYLGANLPVDELAAAARQKAARVLAVSLVYPSDDPLLERDLLRLKRLLGDDIRLVFGGRSAASYREVIERISGISVEDMGEFRHLLRGLRSAR